MLSCCFFVSLGSLCFATDENGCAVENVCNTLFKYVIFWHLMSYMVFAIKRNYDITSKRNRKWSYITALSHYRDVKNSVASLLYPIIESINYLRYFTSEVYFWYCWQRCNKLSLINRCFLWSQLVTFDPSALSCQQQWTDTNTDNIAHCYVEPFLTIPINFITSLLKVMTYIALPIGLVSILVIMSVSIIRTMVILYKYNVHRNHNTYL